MAEVTAAATSLGIVTSIPMPCAGPWAESSLAAELARSASTSHNETAAPEASSRLAIARPIPCAPPVTTARRPFRSIWFKTSPPCSFESAGRSGRACRSARNVRSARIDQRRRKLYHRKSAGDRNDQPEPPALPLRSMVGQLPLEQHIGVRIPEGQPKPCKRAREARFSLPFIAPRRTSLNVSSNSE